LCTDPSQGAASPVIAPGCAASGVTVTVSDADAPGPQSLFAATRITPPFGPAVALMLLPVELPLHPSGNDQVYDVAPLTGVMLYVCGVPWHGVVLPVTAPGCPGADWTVTPRVRGVPGPQELAALTVTVPPVAPTVAVMVVPVELPDHPNGNSHVYEVAPDTGVML